ncbi:MAG: acyl-CoA dehydrogenase family protein [Acidimicrobiia bacterium]|nr:acyl-CoA dehydrogenase family protein [Acidimicrobiia bacterium]
MTETTATTAALDIDGSTPRREAVRAVRAWIDEHVPGSWRAAAARGGRAAIREVRSRADYETWYPRVRRRRVSAVPTWPRAYGGLEVSPEVARALEDELAPYNLGRLNPLGLNLAAPALFAHGTEEQRLRFLPPIVRCGRLCVPVVLRAGRGIRPRVPRRRRCDLPTATNGS